MRQIGSNTRPVRVPSDLAGVRMGVPAGQMVADTFKAFGAVPVTINSRDSRPRDARHARPGAQRGGRGTVPSSALGLLRNVEEADRGNMLIAAGDGGRLLARTNVVK